MSLYSKISLLALLVTGLLRGMEEPPHLKAPAKSAAAEAINQRMILITCEGIEIDKMQKNYLEASQTLKNLLDTIGNQNTIALTQDMAADYRVIRDLLRYEHLLKVKKINELTVLEFLRKSEKSLVSILNACQRFELNNLSKFVAISLAKKLSIATNREQCLYNGSYNLEWTSDSAHLVAIVMLNMIAYEKNDYPLNLLWQLFKTANGPEQLNYKIRESLHKNATPEAVVLFQYWFECRGKNMGLDTKKYPGIITIKSSLSSDLKTLLFPTFMKRVIDSCYEQQKQYLLRIKIQMRNLRTWWHYQAGRSEKVAIIAATGLAAWYGYKYFSKK